jgi:hypothetical protein
LVSKSVFKTQRKREASILRRNFEKNTKIKTGWKLADSELNI